MPKFSISAKAAHNPEETFNRVRQYMEKDGDLKKYDSKMACTFDPNKMTGKVKGGQFSADIKVTNEGSGSTVQLDVDLAFLLTPLKGQIQQTLERKLAKVLA